MRRSALVAAFALVLSSTVAVAQHTNPRPATSPAEKKMGSPGDTDVMAAAAQQRNDARQRAWDQKMKALTSTVCTGCFACRRLPCLPQVSLGAQIAGHDPAACEGPGNTNVNAAAKAPAMTPLLAMTRYSLDWWPG